MARQASIEQDGIIKEHYLMQCLSRVRKWVCYYIYMVKWECII